MDFMVPTLDMDMSTFIMDTTAGEGERSPFTLTALVNHMQPYAAASAAGSFGGKLATVQFDSACDAVAAVAAAADAADGGSGNCEVYGLQTPLRGLSDLPDVDGDFLVPDVTQGGGAGGAIPRQQSHPMSNDNGNSSTAGFDGATDSQDSPQSDSSSSSSGGVSSYEDTPFAAQARLAQQLAVQRLAQQQQQRRQQQPVFMESSESADEFDMDVASQPSMSSVPTTPVRASPTGALRVQRRSSNNRSRHGPLKASPNHSRRMATQWPDRVLDLDTKSLNQYLKNASLSEAEVALLKKERRRKKNRAYAMTSRQKRRLAGGSRHTPAMEEEYNDALSEGVFSNGFRVVPSSV